MASLQAAIQNLQANTHSTSAHDSNHIH
jgi:hypothetical protein